MLEKDRITPADMDEISYPIRELGWDIDEIINPIMYTMKEWKAKSFTPFYKNVMKEGVALDVSITNCLLCGKQVTTTTPMD